MKRKASSTSRYREPGQRIFYCYGLVLIYAETSKFDRRANKNRGICLDSLNISDHVHRNVPFKIPLFAITPRALAVSQKQGALVSNLSSIPWCEPVPAKSGRVTLGPIRGQLEQHSIPVLVPTRAARWQLPSSARSVYSSSDASESGTARRRSSVSRKSCRFHRQRGSVGDVHG